MEAVTGSRIRCDLTPSLDALCFDVLVEVASACLDPDVMTLLAVSTRLRGAAACAIAGRLRRREAHAFGRLVFVPLSLVDADEATVRVVRREREVYRACSLSAALRSGPCGMENCAERTVSAAQWFLCRMVPFLLRNPRSKISRGPFDDEQSRALRSLAARFGIDCVTCPAAHANVHATFQACACE